MSYAELGLQAQVSNMAEQCRRVLVDWEVAVQERDAARTFVDQVARIRECAFDEDITHVLDHVRRWFEDDSADALAQCLEDIRDILSEGVAE